MQELCRPWYIVYGIFIEPLSPQLFFKYQSWYLTPCCGLEVHYPTYALTSVKDPDNIFNLSPKWARTLPFLIYFSWDIYRGPILHNIFSDIKVDIWHPAVGLRYIIPPRHLSQLRTRTIPVICRPWYIFHWIFIESPSTICFHILNLIFDTLLWAWGSLSNLGT